MRDQASRGATVIVCVENFKLNNNKVIRVKKMNWEIIGALGELLGSIAVFITLFFLLAQLKHSNLLARSAFQSESTAVRIDRFMKIAESESLARVLTVDWSSDELDEITKTRISYYIASVIFEAQNSYQQGKLGLLSEREAISGVYQLNTGIMNNPTARSIWAINKLNSDKEFIEQFESIIYPDGFDTKHDESHLWKEPS